MKLYPYILVLAIVSILFGCEKAPEPNLDKVVTESYLFAGEPVDDIYISRVLKFGGEEETAQPINDANVSIEWNGNAFELLPNGGDTGYYYCPDTTLKILVGETYKLNIEYFNKVASAITTVPPPPTNLALSQDTIGINPDSIFGGKLPPDIIATWNNASSNYYYITASNLEANPQPIYAFNLSALIREFIFTEPTNEASYTIPFYEFSYYGKHEVRVYRVNQEYVDLFQSFEQDSRTLNEPKTNVENGLGIFTAFNSNARDLWVVP